MFDFLSAPESHESDPSADDIAVQPAEVRTSAIPAADATAVANDLTVEPLADSAALAEPTSEEPEASPDIAETDRSKATPKREKAVAVSKTATSEEEVIDLPDFSHEPTEPGQYTLRIVFTFRPGDQSVLLSTKSHDVLAIVGELEPEGARALLAPFIAAHEGRLSEIKQALIQPAAKVQARGTAGRSTGAQRTAARSNAAKKTPTASATSAKKDKPTKVVKPVSPAPLPQTNLFND